jgi:hypothetical protein
MPSSWSGTAVAGMTAQPVSPAVAPPELREGLVDVVQLVVVVVVSPWVVIVVLAWSVAFKCVCSSSRCIFSRLK